MGTWFYLIPAAGVIALVYALWKSAWIGKQDDGTDLMQEIAGHIQEGAMAFLSREYRVLAIFVVIVAELLRGWVGGYSLLIFATIMILAVRFVRGGFMEILQVVSPLLRDKYLVLIGRNGLNPDNVPK